MENLEQLAQNLLKGYYTEFSHPSGRAKCRELYPNGAVMIYNNREYKTPDEINEKFEELTANEEMLFDYRISSVKVTGNNADIASNSTTDGNPLYFQILVQGEVCFAKAEEVKIYNNFEQLMTWQIDPNTQLWKIIRDELILRMGP